MASIPHLAAKALQAPARLAATLPGVQALTELRLPQAWALLHDKPLGKQLFSQVIATMVPYSGSIGAQVQELADGHAVVTLSDRRAVRNHLHSVHAVALINLGELTTGLAVFHRLDGRARGIVTDLRIQYLKKARGTLTARCDIEVPEVEGKRLLEVPGTIENAAGEVVARLWATWQLQPK